MPKLGILLIIAMLVGGCAALGDVIALNDRIKQAGYQEVQVHHNITNGYDVLQIETVTADPVATEEDEERIARLVWETYPQELDELHVRLNGRAVLAATSDELEQRFGPRPQGLDTGGGGGSSTVLVVLLSLLVVVAGIVILLVALRRRRRRRPMADPPYPRVPPPS